jgi:HEPN domain-containing protein
MPPETEIATEAGRWLRFADDDLASARLHLATSLILPNQGCYHAQQAAEKGLKALLILRSVRFPKTHDLMALSALLPPADAAITDHIDLPSLTAWVTVARYPTDHAEATVPLAVDAISSAAMLLARIHAVIDPIHPVSSVTASRVT